MQRETVEKRAGLVRWMESGIIDSPHFHSVFHVKDETTGLLLSDTLEIHALNLGSALDAESPRLARWRRFLSYGSDEARRSLAMSDPKMALAVERLEELSQDPAWISPAEERRIGMQILALHEGEAHKAGLAEGREEGQRRGREEGLATIVELARTLGVPEADATRLAALPLAEASAELARLLGR